MNSLVALKSPVDTELRLNLGCRETRIQGFKNLDIQPGPNVDFVRDIAELSIFENGTVSEIYSSNVLEHIPHVQTLDTLKEWRRVLKPGGKLWISVPDFDAVIRLYNLSGRMNEWIKNILYGEQINPYAFHHICFTWPNLRELLDKAGFSRAERVTGLPYGLPDASTNVDTITGQSVAINVEAVK